MILEIALPKKKSLEREGGREWDKANSLEQITRKGAGVGLERMELDLGYRPGHNGARQSWPPSWHGFVDWSMGLVTFSVAMVVMF